MDRELIVKLILTAVLALTLAFLRNITIRFIRRKKHHSNDSRMRAIAGAKNMFLAVFLISLSFIWLTQIKDFALSITAMGVAVVIATKELILCILGGVLRNISRSYRVGDRVTIGTHRGDVVETDLLTTTLLEIGPGLNAHQYTGRSIDVPNSLLLAQSVINESFTDEYVLHVFTVPIGMDKDWQKAEKILLTAAAEVVSKYKELARAKMEALSKKTGLAVPNAEPRVTIVFQDKDTLDLMLRIPVPSLRKGRIEQEIIRRFLKEFTADQQK